MAPVSEPDAEAIRTTHPDLALRPRRYDRCDETCTTDCGHCKGLGKPSALVQGDRMVGDSDQTRVDGYHRGYGDGLNARPSGLTVSRVGDAIREGIIQVAPSCVVRPDEVEALIEYVAHSLADRPVSPEGDGEVSLRLYDDDPGVHMDGSRRFSVRREGLPGAFGWVTTTERVAAIINGALSDIERSFHWVKNNPEREAPADDLRAEAVEAGAIAEKAWITYRDERAKKYPRRTTRKREFIAGWNAALAAGGVLQLLAEIERLLTEIGALRLERDAACTSAQRGRVVAEAERDALAATVARIEALANSWNEAPPRLTDLAVTRSADGDDSLTRALAIGRAYATALRTALGVTVTGTTVTEGETDE
jgi:hypothetical protein